MTTNKAKMSAATPIIIGASGYVAGELLRLLTFHPGFGAPIVVSRSQAGRPITGVFPHLAPHYAGHSFAAIDAALAALVGTRGPVALFGSAPHGETARLLEPFFEAAARAGADLRVVDTSADYRLESAERFREIYGEEHAAPARMREFRCALPDLERGTDAAPALAHGRCIAHPGCFTTAVTLACAPLEQARIAEPHYSVSAVTGSTGSGSKPSATTHHPERHGDLRGYKPLLHRHRAEMELLLARLAGRTPTVAFVPHSGPFARGIHATVHARLAPAALGDGIARPDGAALRRLYRDFYAGTPFVTVLDEPPRLKPIVGTNRCELHVESHGDEVVVFSVIDNLTKGAAGGALQWMNRLCGFEETLGLTAPAIGWN